MNIRKIAFGVLGSLVFALLLFFVISYFTGRSVSVSNVKLTNVTSNGATVVWTTDKPVKGSVVVNDQEYYDDRNIEETDVGEYRYMLEKAVDRYTHSVTIRNLSPEASYDFSIKVNGVEKGVNGSTFSTLPVVEAISSPEPVYGQIFMDDGSRVNDGVVVFQKSGINGEVSQYRSSVVADGTYSLDIQNLYNVERTELFSEMASDIEIFDYFVRGEKGILEASQTVGVDGDQPVADMYVDSVVMTAMDSSIQSSVNAQGFSDILMEDGTNPEDFEVEEPIVSPKIPYEEPDTTTKKDDSKPVTDNKETLPSESTDSKKDQAVATVDEGDKNTGVTKKTGEEEGGTTKKATVVQEEDKDDELTGKQVAQDEACAHGSSGLCCVNEAYSPIDDPNTISVETIQSFCAASCSFAQAGQDALDHINSICESVTGCIEGTGEGTGLCCMTNSNTAKDPIGFCNGGCQSKVPSVLQTPAQEICNRLTFIDNSGACILSQHTGKPVADNDGDGLFESDNTSNFCNSCNNFDEIDNLAQLKEEFCSKKDSSISKDTSTSKLPSGDTSGVAVKKGADVGFGLSNLPSLNISSLDNGACASSSSNASLISVVSGVSSGQYPSGVPTGVLDQVCTHNTAKNCFPIPTGRDTYPDHTEFYICGEFVDVIDVPGGKDLNVAKLLEDIEESDGDNFYIDYGSNNTCATGEREHILTVSATPYANRDYSGIVAQIEAFKEQICPSGGTSECYENGIWDVGQIPVDNFNVTPLVDINVRICEIGSDGIIEDSSDEQTLSPAEVAQNLCGDPRDLAYSEIYATSVSTTLTVEQYRSMVFEREVNGCGTSSGVGSIPGCHVYYQQLNTTDMGKSWVIAICQESTSGGSILNQSLVSQAKAQSSVDTIDPGKYELVGDEITTKSITVTEAGPVRYFIDENGDGIKQDNEFYLEGVQDISFEINKQADAIGYRLNTGWNLIHVPLVMKGENTSQIEKASELLVELNNQGAEATHVTGYRNGQFIVYSTREDNTGNDLTFGDDFNVLPGEGYFIRSYSQSAISLTGNSVSGALEVPILNGWNLVGIYNENTESYGGFEVMNQMNTQQLSVSTLSKWENGIYTNLVSNNSVQYGSDYRVFPNAAYWVRSEANVAGVFKPE
ncbi:fibronectin type III domain-containing protein [Candidatus Dojkabacteria bacterium]|uniref:Fibronectin type III domain-containing protein n=1 Tax=Candidatus Dojkabacteria bacterium TaxID=2099670 RepID=A0A955RJN1_9BACT|nr:fibronectin type III domain-containing protein [Candidatus Dojkabacteria bacterium]